MKRRSLLKSLGALAASSPLALKQPAAAEPPASGRTTPGQPNILVFLSDDHAQWLQQAYGNSEVKTPNMDRIARSGVLMTNAFTTCPVCSPARASFMTGRMPSQHGIHDWIEEATQAYAVPWLKGQILISELLKTAGYHTGLVGKWHCGEERFPHRGFDFWYSYWVNQRPHLGQQNFSDNGNHVTSDGFQSPMFTAQAIRFLDTHRSDKSLSAKPFFLFVGYTDTHSPHKDMPADLADQYGDSTFRDVHEEPFSAVHGTALTPASSVPEIERKAHIQYYAAASSIDREVGKVLDHLESTGQLANTVVVYTGDHGLNAGQHGLWEKGNGTVPQNFLEESIRIPCAISWPAGGIPKNLESDLLVNHCDLFATLLDIAHAQPDAKTATQINSPGRSYLSQIKGDGASEGAAEWRDAVILEYGNARMIRKDGYKLIRRYPFKGVQFDNEFYDLKADPGETTNLISSSNAQHTQLIADLSGMIDSYFARYTVSGHSGLDLEHEPMATPESPWLKAVELREHK